MSEKRRGLGRGIGALIPSGPTTGSNVARPIDVFFESSASAPSSDEATVVTMAAPSDGGTHAAARVNRDGVTSPSEIAETGGNGNGVDRAASDATDGPAVNGTPAPAPGRAGASKNSGSALAATRGEEPSAEDAPAAGGEGELVPVPGASFAEVPVDAISPNARQPRQVFDEEELEELAASIREVGVLQPVVVRPVAAPGVDGSSYELIMGERRWRASQLAGHATVPAIVRETGDSDLLRDALLENLHRTQLNPLEEAAAYQQLLEDFGCTHDELAARIVRSRPQISNTLRLLKLPPLVQRRVAAGVLSAGHARALLGLADGAAMERLAQRIVAEGLSVRATEEIVALGDEPVQPEMRRRPRAGAHSETLDRLANRLTDQLDTRVKVTMGQRKGRIAIEFAGIDDLDRILVALGEQPVSAEG